MQAQAKSSTVVIRTDSFRPSSVICATKRDYERHRFFFIWKSIPLDPHADRSLKLTELWNFCNFRRHPRCESLFSFYLPHAKILTSYFFFYVLTLSNWMYLKLCQCFSDLFQSSFQTSDMPLKLTTVHILHLTKVFKDTWLSSPADQFTLINILANRLLLCYFVLLLIAAISQPASEKNPFANRDNSHTRSHLQSQTDYTSRGFAN